LENWGGKELFRKASKNRIGEVDRGGGKVLRKLKRIITPSANQRVNSTGGGGEGKKNGCKGRMGLRGKWVLFWWKGGNKKKKTKDRASRTGWKKRRVMASLTKQRGSVL